MLRRVGSSPTTRTKPEAATLSRLPVGKPFRFKCSAPFGKFDRTNRRGNTRAPTYTSSKHIQPSCALPLCGKAKHGAKPGCAMLPSATSTAAKHASAMASTFSSSDILLPSLAIFVPRILPDLKHVLLRKIGKTQGAVCALRAMSLIGYVQKSSVIILEVFAERHHFSNHIDFVLSEYVTINSTHPASTQSTSSVGFKIGGIIP